MGGSSPTTLRDVSNLPKGANSKRSKHPVNEFENDDEEERKQATPSSSLTPFKSPFQVRRKSFGMSERTLSPSKLTELYQNCIKLANENVWVLRVRPLTRPENQSEEYVAAESN